MPVFHFFEKVNKGQLRRAILTIKNGQILLQCHFYKVIKGPGTSFQSSALNQKRIRNVCHTYSTLVFNQTLFW